MTHLKTFIIWSSNIFKCEFCLVGDQNLEGRRPTLGQSLQSNCKSECVFTNYSTSTSPSPQINWDYRPLFFFSLHWHGAYSHRCSYFLFRLLLQSFKNSSCSMIEVSPLSWSHSHSCLLCTYVVQVSSEVWRVQCAHGGEPVVLFQRGAVRLLDSLLSAPQQPIEEVLSQEEAIRSASLPAAYFF